MIGDLDRAKVAIFYCGKCRDDIRVIPSGGDPGASCMKCGSQQWEKFTAEEVEDFFATQRGGKLDRARVYFCMSKTCRRASINWEGGDRISCCVCGSQSFEELVGHEKIVFLVAQQRGTS